MNKAVWGVLVSFMVFLFQVSAATAADAKTTAARSGKSKTASKRSVHARPAFKAKAAPRKTALRKPSAAKVVKISMKHSAAAPRKSARSAAAPMLSAAAHAGLAAASDPLRLSASVALALDEVDSRVLFQKNADVALPIASLTKLMTALVVVEARQDMSEILEVTQDDIDRIKNTSSRLPVGAKLSRADMLHIALMSSENRAASALGRNYPGGLRRFVEAMNAKARLLGMTDTRYVEPTGLSSENVASANDLAKLVIAASEHPLLAQYSTNSSYDVAAGSRTLHYKNSNRLVGNDGWEIELQKTGYIREAGRCLVMHLKIDERPVVMVLLDAKDGYSRSADAGRLRDWLSNRFGSRWTTQAKADEEQG